MMAEACYRVARSLLGAALGPRESFSETVLAPDAPGGASYLYCTRSMRVQRSEAPAQAARLEEIAADLGGYLTIVHHEGTAILAIGVAGPLSARDEVSP